MPPWPTGVSMGGRGPFAGTRPIKIVPGRRRSGREAHTETPGGSGGVAPIPWLAANGSSPRDSRGAVLSVTRRVTMAKSSTYTMSFRRNRRVQTSSRICGSYMPTAIASSTAPAHLLGRVDGLSRVLGDGSVRFSVGDNSSIIAVPNHLQPSVKVGDEIRFSTTIGICNMPFAAS